MTRLSRSAILLYSIGTVFLRFGAWRGHHTENSTCPFLPVCSAGLLALRHTCHTRIPLLRRDAFHTCRRVYAQYYLHAPAAPQPPLPATCLLLCQWTATTSMYSFHLMPPALCSCTSYLLWPHFHALHPFTGGQWLACSFGGVPLPARLLPVSCVPTCKHGIYFMTP